MIGESPQFVLVTIVAVICLFFVVLYMRYKHMSEQTQAAKQEALIREGDARLQNEFYNADGTLNPTPFVPLGGGVDEPQETAGGGSGGGGGGEGGEGGEGEPQKSIVTQVVDSIKSGKLLRTLNRFSVRTNQLTERLAERETAEEKEERNQWNRLADEAVNPLFPRRAAKIEREREENARRKSNVERRHAAAAKLLASNHGDSRHKDAHTGDYDDDDDGNGDDVQKGRERGEGEQQARREIRGEEDEHAVADTAQTGTTGTGTGTIYKFNEAQLNALSNVMRVGGGRQ